MAGKGKCWERKEGGGSSFMPTNSFFYSTATNSISNIHIVHSPGGEGGMQRR